MALLAEKVESSEPTRPGPWVTAMRSRPDRARPGLGQGPGDDPAQLEQVLPGRQFRHHAAVGAVQVVLALAGHGQELRPPGGFPHHRGRAVVTGGFQAKDASQVIRPAVPPGTGSP